MHTQTHTLTHRHTHTHMNTKEGIIIFIYRCMMKFQEFRNDIKLLQSLEEMSHDFKEETAPWT